MMIASIRFIQMRTLTVHFMGMEHHYIGIATGNAGYRVRFYDAFVRSISA